MRKTISCKKLNSFHIIFGLSLIAYTVLMYVLFYRQAAHAFIEDIYMSDMKAYLQTMQGIDSGFDFPYPIFFWLGKFFMLFTSVEVAAALAETLLNSLSVVVLYYFISGMLVKCCKDNRNSGNGGNDRNDREGIKEKNDGKSDGTPYKGMAIISLVMSYSLVFISMLYAPKGIYLPGMTHKYLGVFSSNPYHNATYMATRPFAIAAFFLFIELLDRYEAKRTLRECVADPGYIWFCISLLLTTLTKPSYTLLLVSSAGLLMAFRLLYQGLVKKNWSTFLPSIYLGLTFIPTFIALIYQFGGVFGSSSHGGEEAGIGFGFFLAWKQYMENIPLAIVLGLAFPGFYLVLNLKQLKESTLLRFAVLQTVVGLLEFALLYEKGERFIHLNFSWGYMHAMFFAFTAALIMLVKNTLQRKQKWYLLWPQYLAYGWHVLCGIIYFLYIYNGEFYYCF